MAVSRTTQPDQGLNQEDSNVDVASHHALRLLAKLLVRSYLADSQEPTAGPADDRSRKVAQP